MHIFENSGGEGAFVWLPPFWLRASPVLVKIFLTLTVVKHVDTRELLNTCIHIACSLPYLNRMTVFLDARN